MQIIHLTEDAIALGVAALDDYCAAMMCGPLAPSYGQRLKRATGLGVVPGAILACIEQGIISEDEIVNAVSRASRCRRSTVRSVLAAITGGEPERFMCKCDPQGRYQLHDSELSDVLLAA
jgi:hypothetical protein